MTSSRIRCSPGGFSLPEVTIAVGIAALGLITLLGLMPQGLEMARKTGELATRRRIVEQITRDLEQSTWTKLDEYATAGVPVRMFDDQGLEAAVNGLNVSYTVKVEVHGLDAFVPQGGAASATAEQYLRKVVVKIATASKATFDFTDTNSAHYATFHTYIAKSR